MNSLLIKLIVQVHEGNWDDGDGISDLVELEIDAEKTGVELGDVQSVGIGEVGEAEMRVADVDSLVFGPAVSGG